MAAVEENFPRGGVQQSSGHVKKRKHSLPKQSDPDLFKSDVSVDPTSSKKQRLSKKVVDKKKAPKAIKEQFLVNPSHIATFSQKLYTEGLLVLGCLKAVHDYGLDIALPNGQMGRVPITYISDAYTQMLHQLTEDDSSITTQEIHSLHELFHVGMPVRCRMMQVPEIGSKKKRSPPVTLSINPKDVNRSISAGQLKSKMVLSGCISSEEDHGYIVDIGIKGITAFLKKKEADRYIADHSEEGVLGVGRYVDCMVKVGDGLELMSGEKRSVAVVIEPRKVYRSTVQESMDITMTTLLPGMTVEATITNTSVEGLNAKFLKYKGSIHHTHLEKHPNKYSKEEQIKATVLYIHPTTKAVGLSCLPHIVTPDLVPRRRFAELAIGEQLEDVAVTWVDKKRGVYFQLSESVRGLAYLTQLSDKEVKDITKQFGKDTKHKCRIMNFDYMDNVAIVSLKESVVSEQFMSFNEIKPGMVVECTVRALHDKGISVKVTRKIKGFIPSIHLADVPLKHPEKRFVPENKIKCKVLSVDPENSKLKLTCKKTLINSKYLAVTSYDQIKSGTVVEGVVVNIKDNGVLVAFYNDIKGFVPRTHLSVEQIEFPQKVFFIGQVVRGTVLSVDPQQEKLVLSFKMDGKVAFVPKTVPLPEGFEIGKLVEVQVTGKSDVGVDVEILPNHERGFIPKMHLSDHCANCEMLHTTYKVGDIIKEVMFLGSTSVLTLTCRTSLKKASKEGLLVTNFSQLKPGLLLPGSIKKKMLYGIFVDLTNNLVGLAPTKYLHDRKVPEPNALYQDGQAVVAKVTEVDHEKHRFLLSLRPQDCYDGDTEMGLDLLEQAMNEYHQVINQYKKYKKGPKHLLSAYHAGQLINITVTDVNDHGALCQTETGIKGFVIHDHMIGVGVTNGKQMEAVVLHIDPQAMCLELSLAPELINATKNFKDNRYSQVREGQVIKTEVLLVKDTFILVSLKGHCAGRLAYLPSKLYLNDAMSKLNYVVGQVNNVVVKRVSDSTIYGSLQIDEPEGIETKVADSKWHHKLKVGEVKEATVLAVQPFQMNVSVDNIHGRVHISEVLDHISQGHNPFEGMKAGMTVKVKIIGFRDVKTQKYMPISHAHHTRTRPECTMKPSKLRDTEEGAKSQVIETLEPGQKVQAFVQNYSRSCLWMQVTPSIHGQVQLLNTSTDYKVLQNPGKHFRTGQGYVAKVVRLIKENLYELSLTDDTTEPAPGTVLCGIVTKVIPNAGLSLVLRQHYKGRVALTNLQDEYKDKPTDSYSIGQVIKCCVVSCNTKDKSQCVLSCRPSRLKRKKTKHLEVKDKEILDMKEISKGQLIRGFVTNCTSKGVFVSLSHELTGRIQYHHLSKYLIKDPHLVFFPGRVVTASVLSVNILEKHVSLSLLEEHTRLPEQVPLSNATNRRYQDDEKEEIKAATSALKSKKEERKRKAKEASQPVAKKAKSGGDSDSGLEDSDIEMDLEEESANAAALPVSAGFTWDDTFSLPEPAIDKDDSDSDDSEDEPSNKAQSKKKKVPTATLR